MKVYLLGIFQTRINVNCKKYILAVIMIISQLTRMYLPKNLQNAPAQGLTLLLHCFYVNVFGFSFDKFLDGVCKVRFKYNLF